MVERSHSESGPQRNILNAEFAQALSIKSFYRFNVLMLSTGMIHL